MPTEISKALTLISDMLVVTGGELEIVVVVVEESLNSRVVTVVVICGCETPTNTGGQGAMVIGVVDEGGREGGAKY